MGDVNKEMELARKLEKVAKVRRYDMGDSQEAWAIAHMLSDLEEACERILNDHLRRLRTGKTEGALLDALHDIGEELRVFEYHLRESRFYGYLRG